MIHAEHTVDPWDGLSTRSTSTAVRAPRGPCFDKNQIYPSSMLFNPTGPDVPAALIAAQERGEVVFFAGAGVSCTAGLPTFRELVEAVYASLQEAWQDHPAEACVMERGGTHFGQYDRGLRALERRLTAGASSASGERQRATLRKSVADRLKPQADAALDNHMAIIALSRDALNRSRVVTTNFDTLFERAWTKLIGAAPLSHAGAAMPQPASPSFEGIFHIHGRLADEAAGVAVTATDVVLTSAEFGDAYLRSGWAARYVYDLARTNTVVLVGYQAEDPPMRYLLEVLDADRRRFPDLRPIYAFAPFERADPGGEKWEAKGITPIIYGDAAGVDHATCYETVRTWQRYAMDPTGWRSRRLDALMKVPPGEQSDSNIEEVLVLLGHGDTTKLLEAVNPSHQWLDLLASRNMIGPNKLTIGPWAVHRLGDVDFVRACAGRVTFDAGSVWLLNNALQGSPLPKGIEKAWRALLRYQSESHRANDGDDRWFDVRKRVAAGMIDSHVCAAAIAAVMPFAKLRKPFSLRSDETSSKPDHSALATVLWVDFQEPRSNDPSEILAAWPQLLVHEKRLLAALTRSLADVLAEAEDLEFTTPYDRASSDVPSVAVHQQNANRGGFMPMIRLMADLWERIAGRNVEVARRFVDNWEQEEALLFSRLSLHARTDPRCFTGDEAGQSVLSLDDQAFWGSESRREVLRLLAIRWNQFSESVCKPLEDRLCAGPPRDMYRGSLEDHEWASLLDELRFRRLARITSAGGSLGATTRKLIGDIQARRPTWTSESGDRDDFSNWSVMSWGPKGDPSKLKTVPVDNLVDEGVRLHQEQGFEQGQAWQLYCGADPARALLGLSSKASTGEWQPWAWRGFFWATASTNLSQDLLYNIAEQICCMPDTCIGPLTHTIASWLRDLGRGNKSDPGEASDTEVSLAIWDSVAQACFISGKKIGDEEREPLRSDDVTTRMLNEDGGILAGILLDRMRSQWTKVWTRIPDEYAARFNLIVSATSRAAALARARLAWNTRFLFETDPDWTKQHLLPRFAWSDDEATLLWAARARDHDFVGPPELFNALKAPLLEAFERPTVANETLQGLVEQLLCVALWASRDHESKFVLSAPETKHALSICPRPIRHHAAWLLMRWLSPEKDETPAFSPGDRWRKELGPLFVSIWPRDAAARDVETTKRLARMAMAAGDAFPDAVDSILEFIEPVEITPYFVELELGQEDSKRGLAAIHPKAFVRLLDGLLDVRVTKRFAEDFASALEKCVTAEPTVREMPEFRRLDAACKKLAG